MYEEEPLKDYYTLMDIAYIYTWRRVSIEYLQIIVVNCVWRMRADFLFPF